MVDLCTSCGVFRGLDSHAIFTNVIDNGRDLFFFCSNVQDSLLQDVGER